MKARALIFHYYEIFTVYSSDHRKQTLGNGRLASLTDVTINVSLFCIKILHTFVWRFVSARETRPLAKQKVSPLQFRYCS